MTGKRDVRTRWCRALQLSVVWFLSLRASLYCDGGPTLLGLRRCCRPGVMLRRCQTWPAFLPRYPGRPLSPPYLLAIGQRTLPRQPQFADFIADATSPVNVASGSRMEVSRATNRFPPPTTIDSADAAPSGKRPSRAQLSPASLHRREKVPGKLSKDRVLANFNRNRRALTARPANVTPLNEATATPAICFHENLQRHNQERNSSPPCYRTSSDVTLHKVDVTSMQNIITIRI